MKWSIYYPAGYWRKLLAPDNGAGNGGGSGSSSGSGNTGGSGSGSGSNGGGSGTGNTGKGAGSGSNGAGDKDGEDGDPDSDNEGDSDSGEPGKSGKIYGMAAETWAALPASAKEAIKDVAKYRREAKTASTELQKYKDAELSEADKIKQERERLDAERNELETAKKMDSLAGQFKTAGEKSGALRPDTLMRLVDLDTLELGDGYKVKNMDAVIKTLRSTYPEYFKTQGIDAATRGGSNAGAGTDIPGVFGPTRMRVAYEQGATNRKQS